MLVRREEEGALAIGQLSHAWVSGQLARAWGNADFPMPEHGEEIALGAEQHDLGWALFDLAPRLDPETSLPRAFTATTVEEHLEIWRSAPERLLTQSERAALVVSLHGSSLSELRLAGSGEHPALREHVAAEHARQQRLRERLGLDEHETRAIQRLMWTWDGLSLALCNGWDPFTAREVPAAGGACDLHLRRGAGGTHLLDPWPFGAPRVEVRCEARRLAAGYEDERRLRADFESARPLTIVFALEPGTA